MAVAAMAAPSVVPSAVPFVVHYTDDHHNSFRAVRR